MCIGWYKSLSSASQLHSHHYPQPHIHTAFDVSTSMGPLAPLASPRLRVNMKAKPRVSAGRQQPDVNPITGQFYNREREAVVKAQETRRATLKQAQFDRVRANVKVESTNPILEGQSDRPRGVARTSTNSYTSNVFGEPTRERLHRTRLEPQHGNILEYKDRAPKRSPQKVEGPPLSELSALMQTSGPGEGPEPANGWTPEKVYTVKGRGPPKDNNVMEYKLATRSERPVPKGEPRYPTHALATSVEAPWSGKEVPEAQPFRIRGAREPPGDPRTFQHEFHTPSTKKDAERVAVKPVSEISPQPSTKAHIKTFSKPPGQANYQIITGAGDAMDKHEAAKLQNLKKSRRYETSGNPITGDRREMSFTNYVDAVGIVRNREKPYHASYVGGPARTSRSDTGAYGTSHRGYGSQRGYTSNRSASNHYSGGGGYADSSVNMTDSVQRWRARKRLGGSGERRSASVASNRSYGGGRSRDSRRSQSSMGAYSDAGSNRVVGGGVRRSGVSTNSYTYKSKKDKYAAVAKARAVEKRSGGRGSVSPQPRHSPDRGSRARY